MKFCKGEINMSGEGKCLFRHYKKATGGGAMVNKWLGG